MAREEFSILNASGEPIPAGGLVRITGIDLATGNATVAKPDADNMPGLAVVGPFGVPDGLVGGASFDPLVRLSHTVEDGEPAVGDTLGSVSGSWFAKVGNTGFRCLGGTSNGFTNAVRVDGSGTPFVSPLTTKGDIYTRTSSADARKAVGSDGQIIIADSAEAVGWKWGNPSTVLSPAARSCSWLAGLTSTDCLAITVVSAAGLCSAINTEQSLTLAWSADNSRWESTGDFTHDGGNGPVLFGVTAGVPWAKIDGQDGIYLGCDGAGGLLFAFGKSPLCTEGTPAACDNSFVVRVACTCCAIAGWAGPGWYCVEGEEGCDTVVELLDEDKCDTDIVICSGPYATEEEAEAGCEPVTVPCCENPLPRTIRVTVTGCGAVASGSEFDLVYDAEPELYPPGFTNGAWAHRLTGSYEAGGTLLALTCLEPFGTGWDFRVVTFGAMGSGQSSECVATGSIDCETATGTWTVGGLTVAFD